MSAPGTAAPEVTVTEPEPNPVEETNQPPQLPRHKVKYKKLLQRACNEKDEKGKICAGHLKRWHYEVDIKERACGDIFQTWGTREVEVYRCEHCKTLYLPTHEEPRTNVAGVGDVSVFGLTVAPKEEKDKN